MTIDFAAPSQDGFDVYSLVHVSVGWCFAWWFPGTPLALVAFFVIHMVFEILESSSYGIDACGVANGNAGIRWPHFLGDSAINTNCDTFSFVLGFVILHHRALFDHLRPAAAPCDPAPAPQPQPASGRGGRVHKEEEDPRARHALHPAAIQAATAAPAAMRTSVVRVTGARSSGWGRVVAQGKTDCDGCDGAF